MASTTCHSCATKYGDDPWPMPARTGPSQKQGRVAWRKDWLLQSWHRTPDEKGPYNRSLEADPVSATIPQGSIFLCLYSGLKDHANINIPHSFIRAKTRGLPEFFCLCRPLDSYFNCAQIADNQRRSLWRKSSVLQQPGNKKFTAVLE